MEYVEANGEKVPVVGLGTWRMKGETCAEAVEKALDLGYRHVDTAQRYKNESQVGRGIERSDVERDEVFLTTKIWRSNMEYEDVIGSTEESLKKLRTDYVDLLLIHWPSRSVPLEETLDAMNQLVDEGKVRNIGVSNFDVDQLKKASRLSEAPVLTDQVQYHPFKSQEELLSYCQREGVILTAYSPLGHGGTTADPVLRDIGEKYAKSPAQISLRWLTQQENVVAIPKSSSPEHQRQNVDIFDFELDDEEMRRIARPSRLRTLYRLARSRLPV